MASPWSAVVALALVSCAPSPARPRASTILSRAPRVWSYVVRPSAGARDLFVDARFPAGTAAELTVASGAEPFVQNVEVQSASGTRAVPRRGTSWFARECHAGCRVRYRFELDAAAQANRDVDVAARADDALIAPPGTWLLEPLAGADGARYAFRVVLPPRLQFETGAFATGSDAYGADARYLFGAPYSAFGRFRVHALESTRGRLDVAIAQSDPRLDDGRVLRWLGRAAFAVSSYLGRYPVPRALALVLPARGSFIFGKELGDGGASILLRVGEDTPESVFDSDWKAAHEMVHLAVPSMKRRYLWLNEGLATYVEPIARARVGQLSDEDVWEGFVHGMPFGLPRPGDRGLDNTPTWGRTYWGGALFCLLADVEIRTRTGGRYGLGDALRGVLEAGGDTRSVWPMERFLAAGDRAVGVPVLEELHAKLGAAPVTVDLDALWRKLGVVPRGQNVDFNPNAPLAALREQMTRPRIATSASEPPRRRAVRFPGN
jgi:hypothetical protein